MNKVYSVRGLLIMIGVICFSPVFALDSHAATDDYPNRRVEIIVPFAPGQSNDVSSRLIAPYLQEHFKQPFVVLNNRELGVKIGYGFVAASKPDGYTMSSMGSAWPVALIISKDLKYDWIVSFRSPCLPNPSFVVVRNDLALEDVGGICRGREKESAN